eukprot:2551955-Rhodomonas_salina.3
MSPAKRLSIELARNCKQKRAYGKGAVKTSQKQRGDEGGCLRRQEEAGSREKTRRSDRGLEEEGCATRFGTEVLLSRGVCRV